MRPQILTWATLATVLALAACDSEKDTSDTEPDVDTDTDTDTEPEAVWEQERAETSESLQGVYASGQGVFAVSTGGRLWTYRAASGWSDEDGGTEGEDLNDIWGVGSGDTMEAWAVGDAGNLIHFIDEGYNNYDVGTGNFEAVGGPSTNWLFFAGYGGVYFYDGDAWTYETVPAGARINDVWATVDIAFAVGEDGLLLRRVSAAKGWEMMTSPTDLPLFAVGGATAADLWAVGQDGIVLRLTGSDWVEFDADPDPKSPGVQRFTGQSLWDVWGIQNDAVYAVGNNGTAFVWDTETWTELPTGVDNNLYAVHGSTAYDVWAAGNRGMAIHYVVE